MKIKIDGIVKCKSCDFEIGEKAMVAVVGRNEVGKSSVAMAIRGCLTRDDNPAHLTLPMMKHYVNDDSADGSAVVEVDNKNFVMWNASQRAIREVGNKTIAFSPISKSQDYPNTPNTCLLYTSPSPRDRQKSRMPSSA